MCLSSEVVYNEKGAFALRKAAIKDLEESIKLCTENELYQQMRESLFIKSLISSQIAY